MNKKEISRRIDAISALSIRYKNLQEMFIKETEKMVTALKENDNLADDQARLDGGIEMIAFQRITMILIYLLSFLLASVGNLITPCILMPLSALTYFSKVIPIRKVLKKYNINSLSQQENVIRDIKSKIFDNFTLIDNSAKNIEELNVLINETKSMIIKQAISATEKINYNGLKLNKDFNIKKGKVKKRVRK